MKEHDFFTVVAKHTCSLLWSETHSLSSKVVKHLCLTLRESLYLYSTAVYSTHILEKIVQSKEASVAHSQQWLSKKDKTLVLGNS